jgi:hypothetical protein
VFAMPKKGDVKKASLTVEIEGKYILTFTSPVKDEDEFKRMIDEDLLVCLTNAGGTLVDSSWESKSIRFNSVEDLRSFQLCITRRFYFVQRRF